MWRKEIILFLFVDLLAVVLSYDIAIESSEESQEYLADDTSHPIQKSNQIDDALETRTADLNTSKENIPSKIDKLLYKDSPIIRIPDQSIFTKIHSNYDSVSRQAPKIDNANDHDIENNNEESFQNSDESDSYEDLSIEKGSESVLGEKKDSFSSKQRERIDLSSHTSGILDLKARTGKLLDDQNEDTLLDATQLNDKRQSTYYDYHEPKPTLLEELVLKQPNIHDVPQPSYFETISNKNPVSPDVLYPYKHDFWDPVAPTPHRYPTVYYNSDLRHQNWDYFAKFPELCRICAKKFANPDKRSALFHKTANGRLIEHDALQANEYPYAGSGNSRNTQDTTSREYHSTEVSGGFSRNFPTALNDRLRFKIGSYLRLSPLVQPIVYG